MAQNEKEMPSMFYAVTKTSIYQVKIVRRLVSAAKLVVTEGKSDVEVGEVIAGPMLAICKHLQSYIPVGGETRIEFVDRRYWGDNSSSIVAFFFGPSGLQEALDCFRAPDRQPSDPRWLESTLALLRAIDGKHPFYVCRDPELAMHAALML